MDPQWGRIDHVISRNATTQAASVYNVNLFTLTRYSNIAETLFFEFI